MLYRFNVILFFAIMPCVSMNLHKDRKIYTYLTGQEQLKKFIAYCDENQFEKAQGMLLSYQEYLNQNNPYLLYKICLKTENTVLHELAFRMTKHTFKSLFEAMHLILKYHPELATQENINSCLPLNYAKEINEYQMEILCSLMMAPEKFKKAEEYFWEKLTKTNRIFIKKLDEEELDEKGSDNKHNHTVKKASSFTFFSFSKPIKRSTSYSLTNL